MTGDISQIFSLTSDIISLGFQNLVSIICNVITVNLTLTLYISRYKLENFMFVIRYILVWEYVMNK